MDDNRDFRFPAPAPVLDDPEPNAEPAEAPEPAGDLTEALPTKPAKKAARKRTAKK